MARHDHSGVLGLPAELVNDISRLAPVGVDQAAANTHRRSIVAPPFSLKQ